MTGARISSKARAFKALAGVSAGALAAMLMPVAAYAQAESATTDSAQAVPATPPAEVPVAELPATQHTAEAAQDKDIIVTGSYLPRSGGTGSPVSVIDPSKAPPVATIGELFMQQPEFNGNAVLSDPGANSQTGASFINLRGLGPNATLVLLNGKRQVVNSQPNTRGQYGVDSESLTPQIMLGRVEVVKDGASAIYGTDAVAGVVNFITRTNFKGFEMQADYGRNEVGGQDEVTIGAIAGGGNDRAHFVIGGEWVHRTPLNYYDYDEVVDYVDQPGALTLSTFGNPGTYRLIAGQTYNSTVPPGLASRTFADPLCGDTALGTDGRQGALVTSGTSTSCRSNTQLGRSILGGEDRITMLATGSYEVSDYFNIDAQAGFTRKNLFRDGAFGLNVAFAPVVPASNPGNPFGGAVTFSGRVPGAASDMMLASPTYTQTYHGAISANGKLPGADKGDWHYDVGVDFSENHTDAYQQDTVRSDLQNALNGLGGPNCNPATGTPGAGNCFYYNPFANSVLAAPGSAQANDPDMMNWLLPAQDRDTTSTLMTWHAVVRGELFELPGGPVGIAIGYEGRRETLRSTTDPVTHDGGWSFITQEFDFDASRTYQAGFAELRLPIIKEFEISAAGRYEGYQGHSSFNPKLGVIARPFPWLSARGTYGKSFQAPTLQSVFGTGSSSVNGIVFPGINAVSTKAVVAPNPALAPQQSTSYTAGLDLKPLPGLKFSAEFYSIDFTDLVGQEAPQLLVNEYIASGGTANADRFVFDATGTSLITLFLHNINAASVRTNGIDFSGTYAFDTGIGHFNLGAAATLLNRYDYQQTVGGVVLHAVGGSNQGTSIPALPRWKANGTIAWSNGPSRAMAAVHYMSGLTNPAFTLDSPLQNTASYTTVDLSYSYSFDHVAGGPLSIRVAINNVLDKLPPFQAGQQFFPLFSGVYDPRGRRYMIDLKKTF